MPQSQVARALAFALGRNEQYVVSDAVQGCLWVPTKAQSQLLYYIPKEVYSPIIIVSNAHDVNDVRQGVTLSSIGANVLRYSYKLFNTINNTLFIYKHMRAVV